MTRRLVLLLTILPALAGGAYAEEKAAEDPTKIATKLGVGYSDELAISGSLAFGDKAKLNARISESGQWSVGASYLFPVAILTFSAAKTEFDNGTVQTRYSLGGFVPITKLGAETGQWQVFVPFGYTYAHGETSVSELELSENMTVDVSSNSIYLGLFGIRPINAKMTFLSGVNVTKGTEGFKGISMAAGVSYHVTKKDTLAMYRGYIDNSFGEKKKLGISYKREF
ncbi:hypothetical protein GL286_10900 [Paracoccus aestuariivivens]|uniref:Outer membrane beta-barrel protein n=1 Tax=Paracoccus aestuariivivens TaxID=1820333 RepID=A0A6L6J8D0_9RHOB|nr:hypothetical protein [Paracoccus aestuariivivens]